MRLKQRFTNPFTRESWRTRWVPSLSKTAGADGLCDHNNREILLDAKLRDDERELLVTLLHEGWHLKGPKNEKHLVHRRLDSICYDLADFLLAMGVRITP